jgi:cytidyltransferase-like protein
MLDLSIKKANLSQQLPRSCEVTEKYDGTKLSLLRAGDETLLSYKGIIIDPVVFPREKSALDEIREFSCGYSQYALVASDAQGSFGGCFDGAEMLFEFIQRKPTVLREYDRYHDLIAIASAASDYLLSGQRVYTLPRTVWYPCYPEKNGWLPVFQTPAKILVPGQVRTYIDLKEYIEGTQSSLGGVAEGCVVHNGATGELTKIVRDDQCDRTVRAKKKAMTVGFDRDQKYWNAVIGSASRVVSNFEHPFFFDGARLEAAHAAEFHDFVNVSPHNRMRVADDIFLSATIASSTVRTFPGNKIGFYPGAFKPLHRGHWNVIKRASEECDTVLVVASESDRCEISHSQMFLAWKKIFFEKLPRNVVFRFSKNPIQECKNEIENIQKYTGARTTIYTGEDDADKRRSAFLGQHVSIVPRNGVSSTEFRAALRQRIRRSAPDEFMPECLSSLESRLYVELFRDR